MKNVYKLMTIALFGCLATGLNVKAAAADDADVVIRASQASDETLSNYIPRWPDIQQDNVSREEALKSHISRLTDSDKELVRQLRQYRQ
jgi:hypothetical protein